MVNSRRDRALRSLLFQLFMFAMGLVIIYPILWMVANSFKAQDEIFGTASSYNFV